jgi:hypothetical protein
MRVPAKARVYLRVARALCVNRVFRARQRNARATAGSTLPASVAPTERSRAMSSVVATVVLYIDL